MANGTLQPLSGKTVVNRPPVGLFANCSSKKEMVTKGESLVVVESEGTRARLSSTQKQLALFRYENQLFNLLLDQSGR